MATPRKYEYAISACLVGVRCRWNGQAKLNNKAQRIFRQGKGVLVCPEVSAGLPTPRPACEIVGGNGSDVLKGRAKVMNKRKKGYSKYFIQGAQNTYQEIKALGIKKVLLKSGSPSCGVMNIYSGKFNGRKKKGSGVLAALLKDKGFTLEEV
jgi:uncharacterized protein YbbK (DUF523 family)